LVNKLITENAVAYIFKARSPSCEAGSTPLLNTNKEGLGSTDGLVAAVILRLLSGLIVIDESAVNGSAQCQHFNAACQLALVYQGASQIERLSQRAQASFPSLKLVKSRSDLSWQNILHVHLLSILKA
jgi:hypothetical protein